MPEGHQITLLVWADSCLRSLEMGQHPLRKQLNSIGYDLQVRADKMYEEQDVKFLTSLMKNAYNGPMSAIIHAWDAAKVHGQDSFTNGVHQSNS